MPVVSSRCDSDVTLLAHQHIGSSLSLSPQPNIYEYSNAFNFDFPPPALPAHFPSSPSPSSWSQTQPSSSHSRRPNMSHSPSTSCSSLDMVETKPSRSGSPSKSHSTPELDAQQQQRRRFPCVIIGCERRFTSQYTLKVHMEAHKPKPRSSFPCTLGCSERFSRQHDRLRHEVAKHGKICEFLCDDCGRFFSTQKTLGNHKCPVAQGGTRWVNNWPFLLTSFISSLLHLALVDFFLIIYPHGWIGHIHTYVQRNSFSGARTKTKTQKHDLSYLTHNTIILWTSPLTII